MAYALLGHGAEHLSGPRHTVPEGSLLVVTEECGVAGTLPIHLYEAMQDPSLAPLFADPVSHRKALELLLQRPIKIYRPHTTYPHMTFTLINYDQAEEQDESNVGPSGIWPIPSPPGSMRLNPGEASHELYTLPAERAGETYSRSVFPFDAAVRASLAPMKLAALRVVPDLDTSMDAILAANPGIYYHFLCRTLVGPDENLEAIMSNAFSENAKALLQKGDVAVPYNVPAIVGNWLEDRPPLAPTRKQAAALDRMRSIVNRVMTRRRASRSSSGRRRATVRAQWSALLRRITHGVGSEGKRQRMAAEVPAPLLNQQDPHDGSTLVLAAARAGDLPTLRALLARGASATIPDWEGMTPLHWAARYEGPEAGAVVGELLAAGAPTDARDSNRNTPMHGATETAIPVLAAAGIPSSEPNAYGSTPLHMVASEVDVSSMRVLLALPDIVVNAVDRDGETPLFLALDEAWTKTKRQAIRVLLDAGADVMMRSNDGDTVIDKAIEDENQAVLFMLLAAVPADTPNAWWNTIREKAEAADLDEIVDKIDRKLAGRAPHWLSSSTQSAS